MTKSGNVVDFYREVFAELKNLEKGIISVPTCRARITGISNRAAKVGLNIKIPSIQELQDDYAKQADKKVEEVLDRLDKKVDNSGEEDWCQPSYEDGEEGSYQ